MSAATTNGRSRATASPSASALPGFTQYLRRPPVHCPGHALPVEERGGFSFDRRGYTPDGRSRTPLNGDVGQDGEPELLADDGSFADHARADQAFVVAVQAPCVAWVLSGLRQRIIQVQVGHGTRRQPRRPVLACLGRSGRLLLMGQNWVSDIYDGPYGIDTPAHEVGLPVSVARRSSNSGAPVWNAAGDRQPCRTAAACAFLWARADYAAQQGPAHLSVPIAGSAPNVPDRN